MGVNSLPKTVTRQRRGCDLNPGASAPEFSTLTTQLPNHVPHIRNKSYSAQSYIKQQLHVQYKGASIIRVMKY